MTDDVDLEDDEDVVFSREAMTRPIFEEPTPEIERPDQWSEPKGFLMGPMGLNPTKLELGLQFYAAADQLVEDIKRNQCEDYKLVNPVLFLYRHALELFVKVVTGFAKHEHDLGKLADVLETFARDTHNQAVPSWISDRLREIARVDPEATAFRYASTFHKASKTTVLPPTEIYISVPHLQRAMRALATALVGDRAAMSDHRL